MDDGFHRQLDINGRRFQQSLERIAEKYSKLQYEDDAIEVDLNSTHIDTLERYMTLSKKNLNKLESKSLVGLREESLSLQDITRDSQLDFTHRERSGNFETICLSDDDDVTNNDPTSHTSSSLDENQRNYTFINDQPEDQDEQLEMSLQSQGSSLGDLYPNMISQLGKAWRRQHVSEAADSVLRRYRRWRKSNRNHLTNSFHSGLRHTNRKKTSGEVFNKHHMTSPVKSFAVPSTMTKAVSQSPVKIVSNVLGQKSQCHCSPMRRREAPPTAIVMDLSSVCEPDEIVLNKTFIMPEQTLNYSAYTFSPSSSCYPTTNASPTLSLRMKESCMSPRRMQGTGFSVYASDNTVLKERPDIYASPVRQSPYKARLANRESFDERVDIYGSPVRKSPFKHQTSRGSPRESPCAIITSTKSPYMLSSTKSPYMLSSTKSPYKQSFSRELKSQNSVSTFHSSPSPTIRVPKRTLQYSDPRPSTQQQQWSPQLAKSRRQHHGLRRHLSFDSSSLPLSRASYSAKEFDDDFIKLYHKLVCQNQSSFLNRHPCRFCAKSSEASRGHSFSNLAALALSPHRPLLRKRHRDLGSYPQSKRFRDGHYTSSLLS